MAVKQTKTGAAGAQGPVSAGRTNKTPPQAAQSPDYGAALEGSKQAYDSTWGRTGYGDNAFGGASSDNPGHRTRSAMTVNNDDGDEVLNTLKQRGLRNGAGENVADATGRTFAQHASTGFDGGAANDPELRKVAAGNVPTHPSMAPNTGSPSGKVGGATDYSQTQNPVRKPS